MSLTFGLISAVCFGISNAYWKKAAKQIDYCYLLFYRGVLATIFMFGFWLVLISLEFTHLQLNNTSVAFTDYLQAFILCLVCSLGLIFYLLSLKHQSVSLTIPLTSINVFNILTVVIILKEQFTFTYFISFILALLGILFTINYSFKLKNISWNKGAVYSLLASFFWGVTYPFFKFLSPKIGALTLSIILEFCVTIAALFWILNSNKKVLFVKQLEFSSFKHYVFLSLLLIGGTLFFNLAIQNLNVLTLSLFANFQIVISLSIGIIVYKEDFKKNQLIGIVLILTSISISQFF
jgi:drug/metabolite transporter (DMT)-like permease